MFECTWQPSFEIAVVMYMCTWYGFEREISKNKIATNMGSKQYGVDHLNMEINKFTLERKVYHSLNQSECRTSVMIIFRVNFTRY